VARVERRWKFSLAVINLTVALVVMFVATLNRVSSGKELLNMLVYAMIFANSAGIPAVALLPPLVDRLLQRRWPILPLLIISFVVFTLAGCFLAQNLIVLLHHGSRKTFWQEYLNNARFAVLFAVVFGLGGFFYGSLRERLQKVEQKLHEKEMVEERTRKLEAEARLRWLESRVHPHFLFNTLNTISSLIPADPARAEEIVGRLASLLRASLDGTNQPLIPFQQELSIVQSYLEIEKARLGTKLAANTAIPPELAEIKVPPLAIQSLVENAVKYGIAPQKSGGSVEVTAFARNGDLHLEVADSGPGFDLAAVPAGHGLDNLVSRLDALFGCRARLNVTRRGERCVVEMVLPSS